MEKKKKLLWLKRSLSVVLATIMLLSMNATNFISIFAASNPTITINDENLRKAICEELGKDYSQGIDITRDEMRSLTKLEAPNAGITDLKGLDEARNLESINLSGNDLSGCDTVTTRKFNGISYNNIFMWMKNLKSLNLSNCNISGDYYSVDFPNLEYLDLSKNHLTGMAQIGSRSISSVSNSEFTMKNLKTANFSDNNFSAFSLATNATFNDLEKIDLSGNRLWINEGSAINGAYWYDSVVQVGYDKFDLSNQKSLTELASVWEENDADTYVSYESRVDSQNKTIDLGSVVGDSVKFSLAFYGNFEELSVTSDGWELPKMVEAYETEPSKNESRTLITWDNLKMGDNTLTLRLSHANGESDTYVVKLTSVVMPAQGDESAGVTDISLHKAICAALGMSQNSDITKADMERLTTLSAENITNPEGLQYAVNLTSLELQGHFTNLPDLSNLTKLTTLKLHGDYTTVPGLSSLTQLTKLELDGAEETGRTYGYAYSNVHEPGKFDISDLSALNSLTTLTLRSSQMKVAPQISLDKITFLTVSQAQDGSLPDLSNTKSKLSSVVLMDISTTPELTIGKARASVFIHGDNLPEKLLSGLSMPKNGAVYIYSYNSENSIIDLSGDKLNSCSMEIFNRGSGTVLTLKGNVTSVKTFTMTQIEESNSKMAFDKDLLMPSVETLGLNAEITGDFSDSTINSMQNVSELQIQSFFTSDNGYVPSKILGLPNVTSMLFNQGSASFESTDFSKMTNLTSLIWYSYNKGEMPEALPSSLQTLMIQSRFTDAEELDYPNVTNLTMLYMNYFYGFPTKLVQNNPNLQMLSTGGCSYSEIPVDAFKNSNNLAYFTTGDYLRIKKDDNSNWILADTGETSQAIAKLKEVSENVQISYSTPTRSNNYSNLTNINIQEGAIDDTPFMKNVFSIYVPSGTKEIHITPETMLSDTKITVDGKTYKNGETITLALDDYEKSFVITTENSFTNELNMATTSTYRLNVSQGETMDEFNPVEGGVYSIASTLLRNGVSATSMADAYFQNHVVVRYNPNAESGKKYDIRLTTIQANWITDFRYYDAEGNYHTADVVGENLAENTRTYRIYTDDLAGRIKVAPCVTPMGGDYPNCDLTLDTTNVIDISASASVDTADLNAAVSKALAIIEKCAAHNIYTSDSYSNLLKELENAQKIQELSAPTQSAVVESATSLNAAIEALAVDESKLANKTNLQLALDEANKIEKGNHTDSAWNTLKDVIAGAQAVYDDVYATQKEVDSAVKSLNNAVTLFNNSGEASTLDKNNLADGVYSVYVDMVKADNKAEKSMADNAINHTVKLEVKNGEYFVTLDFRGITIENRFGYLKNLSYYNDGYTYGQYGKVEGTRTDATVLSTQKDSDGKDVIDQYNDANNLYPDLVQIKLVKSAIADENGYAPLHVFVPIMEAIAAGNGDQDVLMKVDWSSLKKTSADDPDFQPEEPVEQSPAVDVTDSATGVKVHADKGVFEEGVKLVVNPITTGDVYNKAATALSDVGKKFKLYEVHFVDASGNQVQPNGTVTVSYPIPEGYDSANVVLYRINEDGSKTLVKGVVEDGYFKVITKSFSTYALVEKGSTITDADNTAQIEASKSAESIKTGDSANTILWAAILMLAMAGMAGTFAVRRRKVKEQ